MIVFSVFYNVSIIKLSIDNHKVIGHFQVSGGILQCEDRGDQCRPCEAV